MADVTSLRFRGRRDEKPEEDDHDGTMDQQSRSVLYRTLPGRASGNLCSAIEIDLRILASSFPESLWRDRNALRGLDQTEASY